MGPRGEFRGLMSLKKLFPTSSLMLNTSSYTAESGLWARRGSLTFPFPLWQSSRAPGHSDLPARMMAGLVSVLPPVLPPCSWHSPRQWLAP